MLPSGFGRRTVSHVFAHVTMLRALVHRSSIHPCDHSAVSNLSGRFRVRPSRPPFRAGAHHLPSSRYVLPTSFVVRKTARFHSSLFVVSFPETSSFLPRFIPAFSLSQCVRSRRVPATAPRTRSTDVCPFQRVSHFTTLLACPPGVTTVFFPPPASQPPPVTTIGSPENVFDPRGPPRSPLHNCLFPMDSQLSAPPGWAMRDTQGATHVQLDPFDVRRIAPPRSTCARSPRLKWPPFGPPGVQKDVPEGPARD